VAGSVFGGAFVLAYIGIGISYLIATFALVDSVYLYFRL
jgi:hypothetical protein